jgi:hypothetical protein
VYAPQGSLYMRRDSIHASTALYTKTTGVTLNTGWVGVIAPGMELIQENTLTVETPTINFNPIPQSYSHLKIVANLGADVSDTQGVLQMYVNGSSEPYYSFQWTSSSGSDVVTTPYSNVSPALVGMVASTPYTSGTEITIMGYQNPSTVGFTATSGVNDPNGLESVYVTGQMVTSELGGAITNITLSMEDGPNFTIGSVATLYGLVGNVT